MICLMLLPQGGCHLIFPFATQTSGPDAAADGAHKDVARNEIRVSSERRTMDLPNTDGSEPDTTALDAVVTSDGFMQPDSGPVIKSWSKGFGESGWDVGVSTATDSNGNVYVAGYFVKSVDFGGGPIASTSAYAHDVIVASYDSLGKHRWSKAIGGSDDDYPRSVAVDTAGNVYVTGFFESQTMEIGGTTLTNVSKGKGDVFVSSFTSTGAHRWSKAFGAAGTDYGYGGATDGQGNLYITGFISDNVDFGGGMTTSKWKSNIFIASFTSARAYRWAKPIGVQGSDWSYWIAVDSKANLYITGWYTAKIDLGGGEIPGSGLEDIFLASFTSTGAHRWSKGFGSLGTDKGQSVTVDGQGNVYTTGFYQGTVDFGGGPRTSKGSGDIYLASFNSSSGTHRWSKSFGSAASSNEAGRSVVTDGIGNVYVTGYFRGPVDFGGGSLSCQGSADIFVASYGPQGSHRWSKRFGATGSDMGHGIAVSKNGYGPVTGEFSGIVDFGHGPHTSQGNADLFLLNLGP